MTKARLWALARAAIAVGLLAAILALVDVRVIVEQLRSANVGWFSLLVLAAIVDRVLMAYKWKLLLRARGMSLSLWQAVRLYFVGHLLGTFTPAALGADVYRVTALVNFGKSALVTSTVIFERVIGLAVLGLFSIVALPFTAEYLDLNSAGLVWLIAVAGTLGLVALFASLRPELVRPFASTIRYLLGRVIADRIEAPYRAYVDHQRHPRAVLLFALLSVIELLVVILIVYLGASALNARLPYVYLLAVMPILLILLRLPLTIQGLGVQEGLFAYLLVAQGFAAAEGVSLSILLRIAEAVGVLLPAVLMMSLSPLRLDPPSQEG